MKRAQRLGDDVVFLLTDKKEKPRTEPKKEQEQWLVEKTERVNIDALLNGIFSRLFQTQENMN